MALEKRISELTAKVGAIEDTDLMVISDYNGTTYDTKKVTGAQIRPYKIYLACISQSGTNAPSVPWEYDELTTTLTFGRTGVGIYTLTSSGTEFENLKTFVNISPGDSSIGWYRIVRNSTSVITFTTYNASQTLSDGLLSSAQLEIKIIK